MSLFELAAETLRACRRSDAKLATAESCTGGLIAAALTEVPGSSDVVDRAFVTYSDDAKKQMLGVKAATLNAHGAVSEAVAREMVLGALAKSKAKIAVSVTGIAGPGGGTAEKPVGLVFIACAVRDGETHVERKLWRHLEHSADRQRIRWLSARTALELVIDRLG